MEADSVAQELEVGIQLKFDKSRGTANSYKADGVLADGVLKDE